MLTSEQPATYEAAPGRVFPFVGTQGLTDPLLGGALSVELPSCPDPRHLRHFTMGAAAPPTVLAHLPASAAGIPSVRASQGASERVLRVPSAERGSIRTCRAVQAGGAQRGRSATVAHGRVDPHRQTVSETQSGRVVSLLLDAQLRCSSRQREGPVSEANKGP